MDVDLTGWVPRAVTAGVRRARTSDGPALRELIDTYFDAVWQHEVQIALRRKRPTLHVAERDRRLVGFAAHGIYQPDLFGPLGTDPVERGHGVGRALLHACLGDMAAAGISVAQIGWIGPARFYARAADARIGRTFAIMRKAIGKRRETLDLPGTPDSVGLPDGPSARALPNEAWPRSAD